MDQKKGELAVRLPGTEPSVPSVRRTIREFDRLFDELRREMDLGFHGWSWSAWPSVAGAFSGAELRRTPRVDLADHGDRYEVRAEIPGVPKEEIEVTVTDDRLEIEAEHSEERDGGKEGAPYHEVGRAAFYRAIALPADVDSGRVEAKLDHGVLTVTVPKRGPARPSKRVAVT